MEHSHDSAARSASGRYGSIDERDIDLAFCLASPAIAGVWQLFHDSVEAPQVRHSVSDDLGEVDIVLSWNDLELHVENKLDATFQPDQPERYQVRAERSSRATRTVLLAPERYLTNDPTSAAIFDATVSYEELHAAVLADGSNLAIELADLITHAITQHRRGRTKTISETRTQFFDDFAEAATACGLPFRAGPDRGPKSGFFYAHNWDDVRGHNVELVAKFGRHEAIDLQVARAGELSDLISEDLELADMSCRVTGAGTLIIHRDAPALDPELSLRDQPRAATEFFEQTQELLRWWNDHGRTMLEGLLANGQ